MYAHTWYGAKIGELRIIKCETAGQRVVCHGFAFFSTRARISGRLDFCNCQCCVSVRHHYDDNLRK